MQIKWPLTAVLLLCASFAHSSVTVHAKLGSSQANVLAAPYMHFELLNCGYNIPQYPPSSLVVVGKEFDLKPNQADGSIVGSILGNDEILCGNIASTRYRMTPMLDENTPAGPPQEYAICTAAAIHPENCSTVASLWDPAFAQPATQPPPVPGFVHLFGNPLSSQTWNQPVNTTAIFLGTFDFTGATVLGLNTGGTTVRVNSATVNTPNFGILPAAPANFVNCTFAVLVSNVSVGCPLGNSSSTFAPGTGSTIYAPLIAPTFLGHVTVPTPTSGTDAVTKAYADSLVPGGANATQLQGRTLVATAPLDLYYLGWNAGASQWEPKALPAGSSNALQIQGINVDSTPPTDGQAPVYDVGATKYVPKGVVQTAPASGDQTISNPVTKTIYVDSINKGRQVVPADDWVQSPAADLSASGAGKTITLTPCPKGIDVSNTATTPFSVWIATTGTPEAALVTGGTCTSGGTTGTIIVTTAQTHSAGYTVGSAYAGIQEAINDAGSPNGRVTIPPRGGNTSYDIKARLFVKSRAMRVDAYGAVIGCQVRSSCITFGAISGTTYDHIKWYGGRLKALVNVDGAQITSVSVTSNIATVGTAAPHNLINGDDVAIQYYSANDTIRNVATITVLSATSFSFARTHADFISGPAFGWVAIKAAGFEMEANEGTLKDATLSSLGSPNKFHYGIIVDNDQDANIDGVTNEGSGNVIRCGANFCGAMVRSLPSAVVHISHSEFSMQCGGNGIFDTSGNSLSVDDSIIQGFNQYGIYVGGGLQGASVNNVYEEVGNCANPLYPGAVAGASAEAGIITGGRVNRKGPGPTAGSIPRFANTGATSRLYYIVPKSSTLGAGPILLAGYALHNGAGTVNVYWPEVSEDGAGTVTYDVLYQTATLGANATIAPYLGNATSLTLGTGGSCVNGICTFADTLGAGSAYTVTGQAWMPNLWFWPSGVVMTAESNRLTNFGVSLWLHTDQVSFPMVSVAGASFPSVESTTCDTSGTWSPINITCFAGGPIAPGIRATVYQQRDAANNGTVANSKGRLNFGRVWANMTPNHIITLIDANPDKTFATPGFRPGNDTSDAYIGMDQGNSAATLGVSFGAGASISQYIGNVGDGTNWLTRLNISSFTVKVNTTINGNLVVTGSCTGCGSGPSLGAANLIPIMNPGATNFTYNPNFGIDPISGQLTVPAGIRSLATGAWSIEGQFGPMSDAAVGNTKCGYDIDGEFACSYNGTAQKKLLRRNEVLQSDVIISGTWPSLSADFLDGFDSSIPATAAATVIVSDADGRINYTRLVDGKVNPQTATPYTTLASDYGKLLKTNMTSGTVQLMASPVGGYNFSVQNVNSTAVTISTVDARAAGCSCLINGVTTVMLVPKGQVIRLWSDGTDYFTSVPFQGDTTTGTLVSVNGQSLRVSLDPTVTNVLLASPYTNATTTFSNVTGLAIPVAANTNYVLTCELYYQTSATTANLKIGFTGPSSPTSVHYDLDSALTATTAAAKLVGAAFGASLAGTGTPTTATDLPARVTLGLHNGSNAGTVQLQAAATGVGTVTLEADSFCQVN